MKISILTIFCILGTMTIMAQIPINIQGKTCSHCSMNIEDPLFAARAISHENETYEFDAIECLVNFLKENDEASFDQLLVADYYANGKLVDARSATFLKSKKIASPMGAYISAYATRTSAEQVRKTKGGELYDWNGLKKLFENSRFGLLDHPTHHHHSPGAYAPIGVMGDHLHHKGGFMVSLRYMDMDMTGNLQGTDDISNMEIFQNYMAAPQAMQMRMYMLGIMYAPSDKLTFMVMQNFIESEMELENMSGMAFSTQSKGMGDMKVSALYGLMARDQMSFHINTAVNIPVGDIQQRDDTPMADDMKLAYPMQLGSGTVDFSLGGTYKGSIGKLGWGVQPMGTIRTGENSEGYRFGNQYDLNVWFTFDVQNWIGLSGRLSGTSLDKITGSDDELNAMMAPPASAANTGWKKLRSYLGVNFSFGDSPVFRDFKLGVEYGVPVYQDVEGVQMNEKSTLTAGIRYSI